MEKLACLTVGFNIFLMLCAPIVAPDRCIFENVETRPPQRGGGPPWGLHDRGAMVNSAAPRVIFEGPHGKKIYIFRLPPWSMFLDSSKFHFLTGCGCQYNFGNVRTV